MINYIVGELNKGKHDLIPDIFELYKFGFENDKILIHNGIVDSVNFRSAVNVACHLEELTWAENFIANYQSYLEPKVRLENTAIANSMLLFEQGKFEQVIQNIDKHKFVEIHSIIMTRVYDLKSRYELKEIEELDTKSESFIRFVNRSKKLGEKNKSAAIQFGRILIHLVHRKLSKDKLMHEIQNTVHLYSKDWLVKKQKEYKPINT